MHTLTQYCYFTFLLRPYSDPGAQFSSLSGMKKRDRDRNLNDDNDANEAGLAVSGYHTIPTNTST